MSNNRNPLDERSWTRLGAALREIAAENVPEWTGQLDHDPGVTIAQVFAFLGEELLWRAAALPERGREAIREVITRLDATPGPDEGGPLTVRVDGVRWREVSSLELAGPDDPLFVVDGHGEVTFGDGRHGRRPPSGTRVGVAYREGGGDLGNVRVSVDVRWPPPVERYTIALTPAPGLRVQAVGTGAERFSGEKRVRYFDGRLLSAADLRDEQEYHLRRRRLHNRALHGSGVVTGLEVHTQADTSPPAVIVEPGIALDPSGREVVLMAPLMLAIDDGPSPRLVVVEYAERETDPAPGFGPDEVRPSRVEEGAAVRLVDETGCVDGVAVGRVVLDSTGWVVDPDFKPARVAR